MDILKHNIHLISILIITSFYACSYFPEYETEKISSEIEETLKYIKIGNSENAEYGLIMYPGGLVDPWAYVELLNSLSSNRTVIFICKVPSNLAVLDINAAQLVKNQYKYISDWSIAGHSLGGAMACTEVRKHLDEYANLILLAAYPANNVDLSGFGGKVLSVSASEDPFTTKEDIEKSKSQFNEPTEIISPSQINNTKGKSYFFQIQGGNHSYFGSYGMQNGDGEAVISRKEQQAQTRSLIKNILQ